MFFYYSVVVATVNYNLDALLIDPSLSDSNNVSIYCEYDNNTKVEKIMRIFFPSRSNIYFEEVIPIICFYTNKICKYFNQNMHDFILYYTCIVCSLTSYNSYKKTNKPISCNIELLFNIMATCKFYELCKSDKTFYKFLSTMEEGLINSEITQKTSGEFHVEYSLDELKQEYNNIFGQSIKFENLNKILEESGFTKYTLLGSESHIIDKELRDHVYKSSFERLFSLIIAMKYYLILNRSIFVLKKPFVHYNFVISKSFFDYIVKTSLWFPQELFTQFDLEHYKILHNHILDGTFKRLSNNANILEKVFEFAKTRKEYSLNQQDIFFQNYLLNFFVKENELKNLICVYNFLTEIIDKKYLNFISIVVFLKSSCLIAENHKFEEYLRIIFEIIFFVDIISQVYYENSLEKQVLIDFRIINNNIQKKLNKLQIKYELDSNEIILAEKKFLKTYLNIKLMLLTLCYLDASSKQLLYVKIKEFLDKKNVRHSNELTDVISDYIVYLVSEELNIETPITVKTPSFSKKFGLPDLICVLLIIIILGFVCGSIFYISRK